MRRLLLIPLLALSLAGCQTLKEDNKEWHTLKENQTLRVEAGNYYRAYKLSSSYTIINYYAHYGDETKGTMIVEVDYIYFDTQLHDFYGGSNVSYIVFESL